MRTFKFLVVLSIISSLVWVSCSKDDDSSTGSTAEVSMVDAPGPYESVLLDVKSISLHLSGNDSTSGWVDLVTKEGIYDLLDLQNGLDTVIANGTLPSSVVTEVRLKLGSENYVIENGIKYALTVPSGSSSGLKIKLNGSTAGMGFIQVLIDFDANRSIVKTGSGKYILKPVIRAKMKHLMGKVIGKVTPVEAYAHIYTLDGSDTVSTNSDSTGFFALVGLEAGPHVIVVEGTAPYKSKTIATTVKIKQTVDLGTIDLN